MMFDICRYGAVGDGVTVNTTAIQAAIDACYEQGGGRVVVPSGVFVTGTIWLRSCVELHLSAGAELRANADPNDYNAQDVFPENSGISGEGWDGRHLIIAYQAERVAITGCGRINGRGDEIYNEQPSAASLGGYIFSYGFTRQRDPNVLRPGQLVVFVDCRDVKLCDITVIHSSAWCVLLHGCQNVQVRGYKAYNRPFCAETDALDIDTCRNVTVSDCIFDTGDDCITLRCNAKPLTNGMTACENVTITNCVLSCSSSAFRLGVGVGHVRHVSISNITVARACKVFNFSTSYGGNGRALIESIGIHNIVAHNVSFPLYMRQDYGCYIQNVSVSHYCAESFDGIYLMARDSGGIRDVSLDGLQMKIVQPPFEVVPQKVAKDFGIIQVDEPHAGISLKGVHDTVLRNWRLTLADGRWATPTEAVRLREVHNVSVEGLCTAEA